MGFHADLNVSAEGFEMVFTGCHPGSLALIPGLAHGEHSSMCKTAQVAAHASFERLSEEGLMAALRSDALCVSGELAAFQAAARWLGADAARAPLAPDILQVAPSEQNVTKSCDTLWLMAEKSLLAPSATSFRSARKVILSMLVGYLPDAHAAHACVHCRAGHCVQQGIKQVQKHTHSASQMIKFCGWPCMS